MLKYIFEIVIIVNLLSISCGQNGNNNNNNNNNNHNGGTSCVNAYGQPQICYPPFQNYASAGRKVFATNTCGLRGRQKFCIGLSSAEMRSRCGYCDHRNVSERHSADFLTDENPNNWWQSETLADRKYVFNYQSINLTLNLGKQFHVAFIHLQFKSPRPSVMVIYRKFDDNSPWKPWQYFASNCQKYFNMEYSERRIFQRHDEVICTEEFSSLNQFYNGVVMFTTIHARPGSENFFSNKDIMDWATASQIRIELRNMHTFGDQNDEEELLLTYFYAIKNLQVAARCWCNGHGNECRKSTGEGIEPQLYCLCDPAHHTTGQSCEKCDIFYHDRPWKPASEVNANACQRCNCNENSDSCIFNEELYIKSGNISGGLCLNCRGNTKGPHCDECLEGFYRNPAQLNRCIPCNCDPVGRASAQCDKHGVCVCQPGVVGDKCTRCKGDHFNFGLRGCQPCDCNLPGVNKTERLQCNPADGICYCKKHVIGEKCDSCVAGYFSLTASDPLGCRPCFCFAHTKECSMANGYVLKPIVSEFKESVDGWQYGIGTSPSNFTPMLDVFTKPPSITWFNERDVWKDDYFLYAPKKFLGNRRLSYNLNLILTLSFGFKPEPGLLNSKPISMANDVELISDTMSVSVPFNIAGNPTLDVNNKSTDYIFRLNEESGLWRDRLDYFRFNSILSNLVDIRIRLTNPSGFVRLHKVVMEMAVDRNEIQTPNANFPEARSVEQCSCPPQYVGLSCEKCAPGYHREFSVGSEFVKCIKCMCNNQSDSCNVQNGICDCKYNTAGDKCERCINGFYGDPTSGIRNVCRPCECPGGTDCELIKMADGNKVVCTDCPDNLGGYRCDRCRDNYYGNPKLKITCQPCQCHGNIDYFSSCDSITGKCPNCIYNSAGDNCETCKVGFYLLPNERAPNRCKKCICNPHGSEDYGNVCDTHTSQCPCKPLLMGLKCDECKPGFFNLTSTKACQLCDCFPIGSIDKACHKLTGQCRCKPGVTGRYCNQCEFGYFNLTYNGCQRCICDSQGSTSLQCHSKTGKCSCRPNVIGTKCDQCIENHHNLTTVGCQTCPPCYGLIQKKVDALRLEISTLLKNVNLLNISNDNSWNTTSVLKSAQYFNETLFRILQDFLKNFENIKKFENELENVNETLRGLENALSDWQNNQFNEKLNSTISDIKTTESLIRSLLEDNFNKNLDLLKKFIKNRNENNEKITKAAETAGFYHIKANEKKENISRALLAAERHLNDSLAALLELVLKHDNFIKASSNFNAKQLNKMSNEVTVESLKNLKKISSFNKTLIVLEKRIDGGKKKMKMMLNETNDLLKSFVDIETSANQMSTRFRDFVTSGPDLRLLEKQINSKTKFALLEKKTFNEALEMMNTLNEAQANLTNAIDRANKTLFKLQDLYQDFNEVVNRSKLEAENQLKKLPRLKEKLQTIQSEIQDLNISSIDIITKMMTIRDDLQKIYNDSVLFGDNLELFQSQIQLLLNKSEENWQSTETVDVLTSAKLAENEKIELELIALSKELNQLEIVSKNQNDSANNLENILNTIMNQLSEINNQSKIVNEVKINQYSKDIDFLSDKIESFFQNEANSISKEIDEVDQEWRELNNDLEYTDKEIKRLELIDANMVEIQGNVCYKSGGKVELG